MVGELEPFGACRGARLGEVEQSVQVGVVEPPLLQCILSRRGACAERPPQPGGDGEDRADRRAAATATNWLSARPSTDSYVAITREGSG